jgi:LysR family hydrogen peroxide-inducible transcriptional activator
LNIRDLQYLVAVYDLNSFSKAAERCFVSQPTLSGQLKKLEQELNVALMERSTRQLLFTPVGELIVAEAREVLSTVDRIRDIARQDDEPMTGDFHIGLIPTIGPFLLPKIIPEIHKTYPKLNLFLYELQTEVLVDKLLKGELDAGILAKLDWDHPISETPLYQEKLNLAVSTSDPLASSTSRVAKSILDGRSVLMLEDGHCLRDQALGVCFSAGAKEDKRFQATSLDTLLHMVATGAGITLVPEMACQNKVSGLQYLTFEDPIPTRDVIMIRRKNYVREQEINELSSFISSCANS